ncbi:MAG: flagellar biosynthetic protein FliQ [Deltaproteobacteria bacterium]|nr:flagellar biosynthetic protein FliQ [Deltaproteobacteria bacterium]
MEISFYFIQQSLLILAFFLAPLFLIILISGVIISVFQAMFQIHEGSVSYIAKLIITAVYIFLTGKEFYNHFITLIIKIFEGK